MIASLDDDNPGGLLLARSPCFQAKLEKSRRSIRSGKGLTHKDFWKAVSKRRKRDRVSTAKVKPAYRVTEKYLRDRNGLGTVIKNPLIPPSRWS